MSNTAATATSNKALAIVPAATASSSEPAAAVLSPPPAKKTETVKGAKTTISRFHTSSPTSDSIVPAPVAPPKTPTKQHPTPPAASSQPTAVGTAPAWVESLTAAESRLTTYPQFPAYITEEKLNDKLLLSFFCYILMGTSSLDGVNEAAVPYALQLLFRNEKALHAAFRKASPVESERVQSLLDTRHRMRHHLINTTLLGEKSIEAPIKQ